MHGPMVAIDPRLGEGPRIPSSTIRPARSEQRVLLLDGAVPEMLDLTAGNIRPWENGPPITVPCESTPFSLAEFSLVQVQLVRDLRAASVDRTLLALVVQDAMIEIVDRTDDMLVIAGPEESVEMPIGLSPAIVVDLRPSITEAGLDLVVSARNAESPNSESMHVAVPNAEATLTIGGPSTAVTGRFGRRRPSAVHIVTRRHDAPAPAAPPLLRRVAGRARREVSSIVDRN